MPTKKKSSKKKKSCMTDSASALHGGHETTPVTPFWTVSQECEYYSNLGCHIANIARHSSIPKTKSISGKKSTSHESAMTCSRYREMYQTAMQSHTWLLGIERFDPREYHPDDLERIPEIGLDDGEDDDEWEDVDDVEDDNGGCHSSKFDSHKFMTLTLTNVKETTNICFVTVWDVDLCGRDHNILKSGWNVTQHVAPMSTSIDCREAKIVSVDGNFIRARRKCTTFIVLCPPRTFVHLCHLAPNQSISRTGNKVAEESSNTSKTIPITSWSQVDIESDIQPWTLHENVTDEHSTLIHFPFCDIQALPDKNDDTRIKLSTNQRPCYQCIQSENGQLTHFFHGNYHAIDFECPIGTPLYSPVDGVVMNVNDNNHHCSDEANDNPILEVSGIAATNLFHWNSIMIRADPIPTSNENSSTDMNPLFIEYVHIQSRSSLVQTGDRVAKGQLICKSGSVGFSPTPHLHLGAYRSGDDGAASVRVRFECAGEMDGKETGVDGKTNSFLPIAGGWYDEFGLVQNKQVCEVKNVGGAVTQRQF